jgi:ketosteroid isomerase-like protein
MSAVWEHGDDVACTHPGWATLRGWAKVVGSWYELFRNPHRLQFILTQPVVRRQGDVAWVVLDENLLDGASAQTVSALNIFVRSDAGWRMVAHHGSPVMSS